MDTSKAFAITGWLKGMKTHDIMDVRPVKLTIGRESWMGASYRTSTGTWLYLQGTIPNPRLRRKSTCFTVNGETWYLACYYQQDEIPENIAQFHPFGKTFMLARWDLPDPIDRGERYTYKRVPMEVQYLDV